MASQLNSYCNFIAIQTKEGQALVSNAIDKFTSPLLGEDRISHRIQLPKAKRQHQLAWISFWIQLSLQALCNSQSVHPRSHCRSLQWHH